MVPPCRLPHLPSSRQTEEVDRQELAGFLRDRRARVQPQDVGLETGQRRRTPGLRREEVARLAGMSVDYYIRLEQARGPHPSRQILGALARALRLSDDEREYVYNLAGERGAPPAGPPQEVPAAILHLLDRMDDTPAYVIDAKYDVLAWNPLAAALLRDRPLTIAGLVYGRVWRRALWAHVAEEEEVVVR